MECLGPQCASMLLDWIKERSQSSTASQGPESPSSSSSGNRQGLLWTSLPYQDEAPTIRSADELAGAFEHLHYAVFRRYQNQLTRAERARLDNTIRNVLFKIERYVDRLEGNERKEVEHALHEVRDEVREARERAERLRLQAKRADLKLAQLGTLTPEGFEEFVAEVFEALGYEVEVVGGTGDQGADLRVKREGLLGVVQCKYQSRGVVGSPELQKFLGTIHHTRSHKGFFVTTRTFSLAAEKFVADHPIELIDGPRLVELVQDAIGPGSSREPEPVWF
ncbi:restriction system protein [Singulisphaera sp. GP187]|uniref:restriction endonuclease n=1 Tax=Singulisphaera sp. GP187 TaxID=1882752 RepID=UPI0009271AC4|nr:restriction endonuclease [Singulisphaera sp. GP187]SIN76266.1 restriction system protein [Singulisphaera sp. GP187]